MKIGSHIPPWRIPTFIKGTLSFSSLSRFLGQPFVLCCTTSLTASRAWLLESQINSFRNRQACLATLVSRYMNYDLPWTLPSSDFRLPLLTDPLKRLGRSLGLAHNLSSERCETLFFDQYGRLEFRLIHDLNHNGITRVLEVTECLFSQDTHTQMTEPCLDLSDRQANLEEVGVSPNTQLST